MEQALQLPRLHLDTFVAQPKFLDPIDPPTVPFPPPIWCLRKPPRSISLLDVYKEHVLIATHTVDQKPYYLIGRNAAVCDLVLSHCSISRLHATIIHHEKGATYLVDLGSAHGTFLDGLRLTPLQPTLVIHGSVLKFGASSRSYTFKTFNSRAQIAELLDTRLGLPPEELELQRNTLLNAQIAHRIELSPTRRNMPPLFPMTCGELTLPVATIPDQDAPMLLAPECTDRRGSADELHLVGLTGMKPVRKRSRGQSGNSQASGSSDQSGSTADLSVCMDETNDQTEPKRVQFSAQAPEMIPDAMVDDEIEGEDEDVRVREELRRTELSTSK